MNKKVLARLKLSYTIYYWKGKSTRQRGKDFTVWMWKKIFVLYYGVRLPVSVEHKALPFLDSSVLCWHFLQNLFSIRTKRREGVRNKGGWKGAGKYSVCEHKLECICLCTLNIVVLILFKETIILGMKQKK